MMNRLRVVLPLLICAILLGACSSNKVVSDGWLQKRKYNNGFHLSLKKKAPAPGAAAALPEAEEPETLAATPEEAPKMKRIVCYDPEKPIGERLTVHEVPDNKPLKGPQGIAVVPTPLTHPADTLPDYVDAPRNPRAWKMAVASLVVGLASYAIPAFGVLAYMSGLRMALILVLIGFPLALAAALLGNAARKMNKAGARDKSTEVVALMGLSLGAVQLGFWLGFLGVALILFALVYAFGR